MTYNNRKQHLGIIRILIAGYYLIVGVLFGIMGLIFVLGSLFGALTEMWGAALSLTIMGLLMISGATAIRQSHPGAWVIALWITLFTLVMPGPTDWSWFAINAMIMLYLWRTMDTDVDVEQDRLIAEAAEMANERLRERGELK